MIWKDDPSVFLHFSYIGKFLTYLIVWHGYIRNKLLLVRRPSVFAHETRSLVFGQPKAQLHNSANLISITTIPKFGSAVSWFQIP